MFLKNKNIIFKIRRSKVTDYAALTNSFQYRKQCILRAILGIVHHSCGGKRGKMSGSRLSTIFKFTSISVSDTFTSGECFHIFWTRK